MAARRSARSADRGGDEVQALRRNRPRLTLGAGSVAGTAAVAATAASFADRLAWLLGTLGAGSVAVLAAGLVLRRAGLIAPALVLLGAELAALFLVRSGGVDPRAPFYGAALFLVAELAYAALELRAGAPEPGLLQRRAATVAGVALGGAVAGTAVLGGAAVPLGGGVGLEAVGVAAAVAALLLLGRLARSVR